MKIDEQINNTKEDENWKFYGNKNEMHWSLLKVKKKVYLLFFLDQINSKWKEMVTKCITFFISIPDGQKGNKSSGVYQTGGLRKKEF